jgi:hypothetical protein
VRSLGSRSVDASTLIRSRHSLSCLSVSLPILYPITFRVLANKRRANNWIFVAIDPWHPATDLCAPLNLLLTVHLCLCGVCVYCGHCWPVWRDYTRSVCYKTLFIFSVGQCPYTVELKYRGMIKTFLIERQIWKTKQKLGNWEEKEAELFGCFYPCLCRGGWDWAFAMSC